MPKIEYVPKTFRKSSLAIIEVANEIVADYAAQGLSLTLRQLYYRFVAGDMIANTQREYKRLGSIINDARLAGLLDWNAIEDRGRNLNSVSYWGDPADIIQSAASSYREDRWADQDCRVEVWVEKQALEAVIDDAAREYDVPSFACKGYTSQSEMWRASLRFADYARRNQTPIVIHLGDHDPSGIDMTRDIQERLAMFGVPMEVNRIALNMDQIEEYSPPPNPAKLSDSRAEGYIAEFGSDSWELDALEPATLKSLIQDTILSYCDKALFDNATERQESNRQSLLAVSDNWADVSEEYGEER